MLQTRGTPGAAGQAGRGVLEIWVLGFFFFLDGAEVGRRGATFSFSGQWKPTEEYFARGERGMYFLLCPVEVAEQHAEVGYRTLRYCQCRTKHREHRGHYRMLILRFALIARPTCYMP